MATIHGRSCESDATPTPNLGLLVDTTSFDETDDFGVDTELIKPEIWEEMSQSAGATNPVMMRNGRVRRRMRWKPKSMMRKNRPSVSAQRVAPSMHGRDAKKNNSSDASVHSYSSASFASRFSKRSEHSFGSMKTLVKSNTTKSLGVRALRAPSVDGTQSTVSEVSQNGTLHRLTPMARQLSELSNATPEQKAGAKPRPATRMNQYPNESSIPVEIEDAERQRYPKVPRPKKKSDMKGSGTSAGEALKSKTLAIFTDGSLTSPEQPTDEGNSHTASASTIANAWQEEALPSLSGEDVEHERRVDLRIRKISTERRLSFGQNHCSSNSSSKVLTADELSQVLSLASKDKEGSPTDLGLHHEEIHPSNHISNGTTSSPQSKESRTHLEKCKAIDDECRFSLSDAHDDIFENIGPIFDQPVGSGSDGAPTIPVDLDQNTFLEAEKNLKAIHEMAAEHLRQEEYIEALEVFEEILRGQLARYGEMHHRIGTALHNIGIVHMRRGDFQKAILVYHDAVSVRKFTLSEDHPDVAASLAQLGVAYLETHQHKDAIDAFREALRIRRQVYGPLHPKVAKILNNIGCAFYELNEIDVAKVAFEEALEIQRYNLKEDPAGPNDVSNLTLLSIASTLSNIGSIHLYKGSFEEASVVLEEALLIQQCVYGDKHPVPKQTEDSLSWIDQATKVESISPNLMSMFSQMMKTFTTTKSDSTSSSHIAKHGPKRTTCTEASEKLAPLTYPILDLVRQKLVNGLELACGETIDGKSDHEIQSKYSF